jgi:hypothetical protein
MELPTCKDGCPLHRQQDLAIGDWKHDDTLNFLLIEDTVSLKFNAIAPLYIKEQAAKYDR